MFLLGVLFIVRSSFALCTEEYTMIKWYTIISQGYSTTEGYYHGCTSIRTCIIVYCFEV